MVQLKHLSHGIIKKTNFYSANNTNTQIKVKGWRTIGVMEWGNLFYNDELRIAQLYLHTSGLSFTANETKKYTSPTLGQFMPKSNVVGACWMRPDVTVVILPHSSDNFRIHSKVAQSNIDLNISLTWTY